jgi:diguanylate cyclase (GGDEF)-like protein
MGDVNSLKFVNDTFGHIEGDILLKNVANLMKSFCRKEDIIASVM